VQNGEGETGAPCEVGGVTTKVGEVLLGRHAVVWRPLALAVARGGAYVVDARHPGRMIRLIVLRPERFESEPVGRERGWRIEADRHKLIRGHGPDHIGRFYPSTMLRPDGGNIGFVDGPVLSEAVVQSLLDELCTCLGFCLPPANQAQLRTSPPITP